MQQTVVWNTPQPPLLNENDWQVSALELLALTRAMGIDARITAWSCNCSGYTLRVRSPAEKATRERALATAQASGFSLPSGSVIVEVLAEEDPWMPDDLDVARVMDRIAAAKKKRGFGETINEMRASRLWPREYAAALRSHGAETKPVKLRLSLEAFDEPC